MALPPPEMHNQALLKQVGLAIRNLRVKRDLSQLALARSAGINRTHLVAVEAGQRNVTLHTMSRLAEALGVEVGDFFKNGEQQPDRNPVAVSAT